RTAVTCKKGLQLARLERRDRMKKLDFGPPRRLWNPAQRQSSFERRIKQTAQLRAKIFTLCRRRHSVAEEFVRDEIFELFRILKIEILEDIVQEHTGVDT